MEKATSILSKEHKNILKAIGALIDECGVIESGGKLNEDFFRKAIDFIRNYADKFHHAKEEDILFVELNKDSVQMHCNPVEQMLHEHDLGRQFVKGMEEGLDENNKEKVIKNAREYAQLLREHISKEDDILYPMADEALAPSAQKSMLEEFKKVENEKFSPEIKEKYFSFVKNL